MVLEPILAASMTMTPLSLQFYVLLKGTMQVAPLWAHGWHQIMFGTLFEGESTLIACHM